MRVTFWGVRGTVPAPGPGTVRYGGNTSCVSVRTEAGRLLVLDCGTGARNLGRAMLAEESREQLGDEGAAIFLSHTHWDHIQGFPFFGPLYVAGNVFQVFGPAQSSALLEGILEGQMAPEYFPVQTLKNMGARIGIVAVKPGTELEVLGCRVSAVVNPHGSAGALAFRIEDAGRSVVYVSDAGYGAEGASDEAVALYRDADLLIHDSTFTPEDRARFPQRGLASVTEAADAAVRARARRLALFHYSQDYTDSDVDRLLERGQQAVASARASIEVVAAAEGMTLQI